MVRIGRPVRLGVLALGALLAGGCQWTVRASVDMDGGDANGTSRTSSLSADGRFVAFLSSSSDLVPGDGTSVGPDVFVRDLRTGATTRANVDMDGGDPDRSANDATPVLSADGRYVAFTTAAGDLVPGDNIGQDDVFVRDLQAGTTIRVSIDLSGGNPDGQSYGQSISADGRYVAFVSTATDLIPVDENPRGDVFVRDLQTGTTTLVSVDSAGGGADGRSGSPSMSADGRYIAFLSEASDLVAGEIVGGSNVFVRDLQAGTTARVSVDTGGGETNGFSFPPSISADGHYVTFMSAASDLVAADGNGADDVFVRDLVASTTTRVSVDATGGDSNSAVVCWVSFGPSCVRPAISGDGRYVAFVSAATDLVAGDTNGVEDVFVRDTVEDVTTRASVDFFGREAHAVATRPSLSADGHYVAFDSVADNIVSGDGNGREDIFVRAVQKPTIVSTTPSEVAPGNTTDLTVVGSGFRPGAAAQFGPGGVTVTSVAVLSNSELLLHVTVDSSASLGTRTLWVWNPGTGPGPSATGFGLCVDCLTVTAG